MPETGPPPPLVLASASAVRARLLRAAGVPFQVEPVNVDEAQIKSALGAQGASAADTAQTLADLKAQRGSQRDDAALVIGADQILECGDWFDKPKTLDDARRHLETLSGRVHRLFSAVAVARAGTIIWRHGERADLTMRKLSPPFVDAYLETIGESVLQTVGAYEIEGPGAQLFETIEGDYFNVLGLPLLPLLEFLRTHKAIAS